MTIYKITCIITNKHYIGQTVQKTDKRIRDHFKPYNLKKKSKVPFLLKQAILKYGKENFKWTILDIANNIEELNEKERYWIKTLNTVSPNGYNLQLGGNSGGKFSEELILKHKEIYNINPELRNLISQYSKNNWSKEEYRKKISKSRKENWSDSSYRIKQHESRLKSWESRKTAYLAINPESNMSCFYKNNNELKDNNYKRDSIYRAIKNNALYKGFYWRIYGK